MVVGILIGIIFRIVTFPGTLVSIFVQSLFDGQHRIPEKHLAVDDDVELDDVTVHEETLGDSVRVLGPGEEPDEGETVVTIDDYHAVDDYTSLFKLILGPFATMTVIGAVFMLITAGLFVSGTLSTDGYLWLLPFWLGFSVLAQSFPNQTPTDALWVETRGTDTPLRFLGYPVVGFSKAIDKLQFLWLDAIYALAVWYAAGRLTGFYGGV